MKKRRAKQEMVAHVEMVGTGIVIVGVVLVFFWAMWWMFQQGG